MPLRMRNLVKISAITIAAVAFVVQAQAAEFSKTQKSEIEEIVRDYLTAHPELLQEMAKKLEAKQQAEQADKAKGALASNAKGIFRANGDFVAGNPKGDVTLVEFFDYNCGWCKKGFPEVVTLIKGDPNLRVVMKEFPIFGEDSEYAARAALAANKQGKYWELHTILFKHEGKVTREVVDQALASLPLDAARLEADIASEETSATLAANQKLAQELGINGTPAFVIGDQLVPGYLPQSELASTIGEVRKAGTCNNLC
jgi:protein-disulfide isomerase